MEPVAECSACGRELGPGQVRAGNRGQTYCADDPAGCELRSDALVRRKREERRVEAMRLHWDNIARDYR